MSVTEHVTSVSKKIQSQDYSNKQWAKTNIWLFYMINNLTIHLFYMSVYVKQNL